MGLEFLSTFLFELLDSNVCRKVAPHISYLKSLDFLFGLQMMFPFLSTMNIAELPGGSGVEAAVLGHEVTYHEAFPHPRTKTLIESGVSFRCALQSVGWTDRIIVIICTLLPVNGE